MEKGKVNANMIYLKRGGYIHKGEDITSDDVNDFGQLVEKGYISIEKAEKNTELMKLKKDELQQKCKDSNIDFDESNTKAELIELIEKAEKDTE